jgi:hypothetical protein
MSISPGSIERARATAVESILEAHGVKLRGHVERIGPCPVCGGADRFGVNTRKQLFNCRGCGARGDAIALEQFLSGAPFKTAVERLLGGPQFQHQTKADTCATTSGGALALWITGSDPRVPIVKKYFESRALTLGDDLALEVLRWHASISAMLALFRNIHSDEPQAVSRTFLDSQGRKLGRKFLGPVAGAAVKLDQDVEVLGGLHIGEGVETAMAARQFGLRPTWALGSAGAIASFPLINGVESLTLLREHDDASAKAVDACARRWYEAGREVIINEPVGGKDLNDVLRGEA